MGTDPVAGNDRTAGAIVNTGTIDSVGSSSILICENKFISDGTTSTPISVVGLARTGDTLLTGDVSIINNDVTEIYDIDLVPMIYNISSSVVESTIPVTCRGNIGHASESAYLYTATIAASETGLVSINCGFRPSRIEVRAISNNASTGAFWIGSVHWDRGGERTDLGVSVNTGNWSQGLTSEFYRLQDASGNTTCSAEFLSWNIDGFNFNVLNASYAVQLQITCIP